MGKKKSNWPDAVTITDSCRVFNITQQAVTAWFKNGCPRLKDGRMCLSDVYKWLMDREREKRTEGKELYNQKLETEIEWKNSQIRKNDREYILRVDHDLYRKSLAGSHEKSLEQAIKKNYHQFSELTHEQAYIKLMEFGREWTKAWIGTNE